MQLDLVKIILRASRVAATTVVTSEEEKVSQKMEHEIQELFLKIKHSYHSLETVHPYHEIFQNYYQENQHKEFNLNPNCKEQNMCLI